MRTAELERARRMWAEGRSIKGIAAELGITRCAMASVIQRNRDAFPRRRTCRRTTDEDLAVLARLRSSGASDRDIARATGMSESTVRFWLEREGLCA